MEELVLEAEEQLAVPELGEFRSFVDDHCMMWRRGDELFVKAMHILGVRVVLSFFGYVSVFESIVFT